MDDVNQNESWGMDDDSNEVDPRARPVILAAQALQVLRDHVPGSSAVPVMPKLRGCMDGLLLLQGEFPPLARKLFDRLDLKVQVTSIRLSKDLRALDAVRDDLIERVVQLGDVLMDDLMYPKESSGES